MRISINILRGNPNAIKLCRAFAGGVAAKGDRAVLRSERNWQMKGYDAAVFWGYRKECQRLVQTCGEAGIPFIYFDLAYWDRDRQYKVTINNRHPTSYMMRTSRSPDRFNALGLKIAPWRKGTDGHILLAGMSGKAAWSWNMKAEEWEKDAVAKLSATSSRRIIYRPKPSWPDARPIAGSDFSTAKQETLDQVLAGTHCVVTHHSNVGVDGVLAGIPVITRRGAALHMGLSDADFSLVEAPAYPDGREQWAANLAYCQWSLHEMRNGRCWNHMRTLIHEGAPPALGE